MMQSLGLIALLARAANPEQEARIRDYLAYRSRGVRFVREPRRAPYGMVAVFEDLYGNRWGLLGPPP